MEKESYLDQLCQAYNLKPEAVKRDFNNRNQAKSRANFRQEIKTNIQNAQPGQNEQIIIDAELKGLIAVTADLNQFTVLRQELTEDDLKNPYAKQFFRTLEECYTENNFSIGAILSKCNNTGLVNLITEVLSSELYKNRNNIDAVIKDTIKLVKKNKLDDQRSRLLQRIRSFTVITDDDKQQLNRLLSEKFELDQQVQKLQK